LFGVHERVDIVNSTLGKALGGGSGGFSSGSKEVVEMQRQKGRPYLFSNAVAPALVAGAREALAILEPTSDAESPQLAALRRNTALFRHEMGVTHGFKVLGHPECPIAPILLGDARLAGFMSQHMLERGVYVVGFSFPVVPKGQARIRVQLSAAHTEEDIKAGVKAFVDARDAAKAQGLW
jgi:glycine C-acetyltransferase